jgi:hypothetical protein
VSRAGGRYTALFTGTDGLVKPAYLTHSELARELARATGARWENLAAEARQREQAETYPSFPPSARIHDRDGRDS